MNHDFDMIVHKFPANDDLHIHFISDVHLGAQEHMEREWADFCDHLLDDPRAYLVIGGDMVNNCTRNSVSDIYTEVLRPRDQKRIMAEMLSPLRERLLCAVPGNHEGRGRDADDCPLFDILCKIDREDLYRENMGFVKIMIGNPDKDSRYNPTYMLVVMHGAGGGMLPGAVINRNERIGYTIDGADALLVGHSHKPMISQPGKIYIDKYNNLVSIKPFKVVVATSWMSYGGYAARKQLLPATHAPQIITLNGKKKEIKVTM